VPESPLHTPLYLPVVDRSAGVVRGFRISPAGGRVEIVFSLSLEADERVVAVATRSPDEHVSSAGRVLGDRRVLYKYLNPHLLVVATLATSARGARRPRPPGRAAHRRGARADASEHQLRVRLIDAVSGALLDSRSHAHAKGPVNVVASEHWVVYSFGNAREDYTEMVVLELFESSQPDERVQRSEFSSLDAFQPYVASQSYALRGGISALGVTQTRRGITSRLLLCAARARRDANKGGADWARLRRPHVVAADGHPEAVPRPAPPHDRVDAGRPGGDARAVQPAAADRAQGHLQLQPDGMRAPQRLAARGTERPLESARRWRACASSLQRPRCWSRPR
jgi:hypothetical protein